MPLAHDIRERARARTSPSGTELGGSTKLWRRQHLVRVGGLVSGSVRVRVRVGFGPAAVRMTPWIDRAGLLFTSRSVHPMIWQVSSDPDWFGRLLLTRVLRMAGPGRAATGSPACAAAASVDVCLPPPYTGSAFGVRRVPLRAATAPGKDTPKGTGSCSAACTVAAAACCTVQALCHNGNALTPGRIGNGVTVVNPRDKALAALISLRVGLMAPRAACGPHAIQVPMDLAPP